MPGKKKLTDLTGDGKITRKDFLRGAGVPGFKKGGKVDLDKLPRSMKKKTRTGLFSSEFTDVKETKKPRTKSQKEAVQSEMDELRAKGAMSFPRPDSVSVEERARAKELVRKENRRSRSERKTQQEMGSFKEGGKVKVERINKKGRTAAAEKMLRRLGEMKQGRIQEKYPSKGTREEKRPPHRDPGADDRMKKFEESAREAGFKDGGSVCAGGGSAIQGKKFSGTY